VLFGMRGHRRVIYRSFGFFLFHCLEEICAHLLPAIGARPGPSLLRRIDAKL
jgi:hypothetical protein